MRRAMRRLLAAGILGGLVLTACSKSADAEREQYRQEDTAVVIATDVEILYSDSAVVRVRITAPLLRDYSERENPRQEFPDGVKVEFLDAAQAVTSTLTALQGIRYQEKGQIHVRDSVVLSTIKQEKLETEELIWDEKTEKVFTEKFVKVTKPGEVIYGYGLEANQDFSYWKITVPKGRIKVDAVNEALD
jgi:LPS export ABC transporter protein LptC